MLIETISGKSRTVTKQHLFPKPASCLPPPPCDFKDGSSLLRWPIPVSLTMLPRVSPHIWMELLEEVLAEWMGAALCESFAEALSPFPRCVFFQIGLCLDCSLNVARFFFADFHTVLGKTRALYLKVNSWTVCFLLVWLELFTEINQRKWMRFTSVLWENWIRVGFMTV